MTGRARRSRLCTPPRENSAPTEKETNVTTAAKVGKLIAERGASKNVKRVVFDRGGYKYHGKVKALTQREGRPRILNRLCPQRRSQDRSSSGESEPKETTEKVVFINRCAKVVKGGRRFSFSALIVSGNHNGRVGIGFGKANEVSEAIRKATESAKKRMVNVAIHENTIPMKSSANSEVVASCSSLPRPAPASSPAEGFGRSSRRRASATSSRNPSAQATRRTS